MTIKDRVINDYFDWLCEIVCGERHTESLSFRKLLGYLHNTEFVWSVPMDENRAWDGVDLRYRFACRRSGVEEMYLKGPCSVLEMMVALAVRCEIEIMDDPLMGDRTGQWFWGMIVNLGLGAMSDDRFDENYVREVVERFLYRDYDSDGKGGLFTVKNCDRDLRTVEIWYQLNWYLNTIS